MAQNIPNFIDYINECVFLNPSAYVHATLDQYISELSKKKAGDTPEFRAFISRMTTQADSLNEISDTEIKFEKFIKGDMLNDHKKINELLNPCRSYFAKLSKTDYEKLRLDIRATNHVAKMILIDNFRKNFRERLNISHDSSLDDQSSIFKSLEAEAMGILNNYIASDIYNAVYGYTNNDYLAINKIGRGLMNDIYDVSWDAFIKMTTMDLFFDVYSNPLLRKYRWRLFRGVNGDKKVAFLRKNNTTKLFTEHLDDSQSLNIGDILYDNGFSSASLDANSSLNPEFIPNTSQCCLFTFLYPREMPLEFMYIADDPQKRKFTFGFTETEVLLPRGLYLQVKSFTDVTVPLYDIGIDKTRTIRLYQLEFVAPIHPNSHYKELVTIDPKIKMMKPINLYANIYSNQIMIRNLKLSHDFIKKYQFVYIYQLENILLKSNQSTQILQKYDIKQLYDNTNYNNFKTELSQQNSPYKTYNGAWSTTYILYKLIMQLYTDRNIQFGGNKNIDYESRYLYNKSFYKKLM